MVNGDYFTTELINPLRYLKHFTITSPTKFKLSRVQYPKSAAISNAASISITDPLAIS